MAVGLMEVLLVNARGLGDTDIIDLRMFELERIYDLLGPKWLMGCFKLRCFLFLAASILVNYVGWMDPHVLQNIVMEAVNVILNGSLNVGVLVQGKKVRDDNRTLLQSGISSKDTPDSLRFMLESSPAEAPPYLCPGDPLPLSCEASVLLTGSPSTSLQDPEIPGLVSDHTLPQTNPVCQAIVALPYVGMKPLAAVPVNQKSTRSEVLQRRTRRPFSVTEVEALVQAVEDLGTGRWRDIKLCAFDNANHRTYVDLKDTWKTLVHTAKISPRLFFKSFWIGYWLLIHTGAKTRLNSKTSTTLVSPGSQTLTRLMELKGTRPFV